MIVTVTMNAALDRTLSVPNFQRGHRHRASQGLTLVIVTHEPDIAAFTDRVVVMRDGRIVADGPAGGREARP